MVYDLQMEKHDLKEKKPIRLYLIVPCYNEEEVLAHTADSLGEKVRRLISAGRISTDSRVVFVDDGSEDQTAEMIHELHEKDPLFSGIHFVSNCGHQNAVLAGYHFAEGKCDAAISIDADLQQDIEAIDVFLDHFEAGDDVVYGVRNSRDTDGFFKKATSQFFYRLMRFLGADTIPNHADYRLLSGRALTALKEYREVAVFLRGLIPSMGFRSSVVHFDVREREAGHSKYTLKKMFRLAGDGITSFSIRPMHLIMQLGLLILLIALVNMIYTVVVYLQGRTVPGWATIVLSVWGLGGIQLLAIGVVGEYVGKNYQESKHRPRYLIREIEHASDDNGPTPRDNKQERAILRDS